MKFVSFLLLCGALWGLVSCQHTQAPVRRDIASLKKSDQVEGIWFLQGSSTLRGPYNGEIELRKSFDGTYDVIRVITYINYFYDGLKVQEVWTGKAVATDSSIVVNYELRQGDFISRLGHDKRSMGSEGKIFNVLSEFRLNDQQIIASEFSDLPQSQYREWISTKRDLERNPLWHQNIEWISLASGGGTKTPARAPSSASQLPRLMRDATDREFYSENHDIIRVVNKVVDNFAIAEALPKRNAYAISVDHKLSSFERNTRTNHLGPWGLVVGAQVFSNGSLQMHTPTPDSLFLTSLYTASLAAKYKVTQTEDTRQELKKNIQLLNQVYAIAEKLNTRLAAIHPLPKEPEIYFKNGWKKITYENAEYLIFPDQNAEALWAYINAAFWSLDVFKTSDAKLSVEILNSLEKVLGQAPTENITPLLVAVREQILTQSFALGTENFSQQIKDGLLGLKFNSALAQLKAPKYPNDKIFYKLGQSNWGENFKEYLALDTLRVVCRVMVDSRCQKKFEGIAASYKSALRDIHLPYVELINKSAESFEKNISAELRLDNDSITAFLNDMPYPRANSEMVIDQKMKKRWVASLLESDQAALPQTLRQLKNEQREMKAAAHKNSADYLIAYPIYELGAYSSSFLLKDSPFKNTAVTQKGYENPAVDYLYVYWMAKYFGF